MDRDENYIPSLFIYPFIIPWEYCNRPNRGKIHKSKIPIRKSRYRYRYKQRKRNWVVVIIIDDGDDIDIIDILETIWEGRTYWGSVTTGARSTLFSRTDGFDQFFFDGSQLREILLFRNRTDGRREVRKRTYCINMLSKEIIYLFVLVYKYGLDQTVRIQFHGTSLIYPMIWHSEWIEGIIIPYQYSTITRFSSHSIDILYFYIYPDLFTSLI